MAADSLPDAALADAVLAFWFGADPAQPLANSARWFDSSPAFDAEVRERFGPAIERAGRGELDAWREQPRSALALVILLDQFTRNVYRGTAQAFAHDARALRCTLDALERGLARELPPVQRWFLLMPLMHAEDGAVQARALAEFTALAAGQTGEVGAALEGVIGHARRHHDVIARFGRFPARNAALGRKTTPEEADFLREHPGGL